MSETFSNAARQAEPKYIQGTREIIEGLKDTLANRQSDPSLAIAIDVIESLVQLVAAFEKRRFEVRQYLLHADAKGETDQLIATENKLCEL